MKRSIAFLLLVALAVGFLTCAYQTIGGYSDDVTVEVLHVHGDPERVDGVVMELETFFDSHLLWYTRHTAGDPGVTETKYVFSQDDIHEYEWDWDDEFNFYISSGFGISTSGGTIEMGTSGWGAIVSKIAKDVEAGQTVEKEILLEDYTDYYPMDYYANIQTPVYYIDEYRDSLQINAYDSGSFGWWYQNFRFPVQPGTTGQVSLTKSQDGGVVEVSVSLYDVGQASLITSIWDEGMYFAPVFTDYDGTPLETGEYLMGYGLYHIPFKVDGNVELHSETTLYAGAFDQDNVELIYPMDPDDIVVAMEADDAGRLHMVVREDGMYRYCALDIESRTITHRIDLMEAGEDLWCQYKFYLDQGLIYLQYMDQAALLDVTGEPKLEFIAQFPEDIELGMPESVSYREGTLYMAAMDWINLGEDQYEKGYYLAALDAEGLAYLGYYFSSLKDNGHTYSYVNQNGVTILE